MSEHISVAMSPVALHPTFIMICDQSHFKIKVRAPHLGTVEGVVQLVGELLLLLPGRLDQAGVHEGESLHDLLHREPSPGRLLAAGLGRRRGEHLQGKDLCY